MVTIDLTRPTLERLADPNYKHPWISMYPPSRALVLEAQALRRRREAAEKKAQAEAAEKKAAEEAAAAAAAAAEKAEQEAKEKAAKEAEIAAAAAAAAEAARWIHQVQQTDLRYCYHRCPGHQELQQPILNGKVLVEKKQSEKATEKKTEPENKKTDQKKDQKNEAGKKDAVDVKDGPDNKPGKSKASEKNEKNEKSPKGILKEGKQVSSDQDVCCPSLLRSMRALLPVYRPRSGSSS